MSASTTIIEVNGHELEIPAGLAAAGLSGREINQYAGAPAEKITYEITKEGHRLIPAQEKVQVQPGARFGTMDRVVAGGQQPVVELASVNGVNFPVPQEGALMLPQQIKTLAGEEQKPVLYRITSAGHEVMLADQPLRVRPGDCFGTLDRVVAGGRDSHRINAEIRLLQHAYGNDAVYWTPDQQWVKLIAFTLPAHYSQPRTELLIHVPASYGLGVPIRECYLDTGLRYHDRSRNAWRKIPHYYDAEDSYSPREGVKQQGWGYFCLHCKHWGPRDNFLTFLNALVTVLSNPFAPWPTS